MPPFQGGTFNHSAILPWMSRAGSGNGEHGVYSIFAECVVLFDARTSFFSMGLKVFDFCCSAGHVFEGWFASDDDWKNDVESGRFTCPVCGSPDIDRRPTAPNFGRVFGTTRTDVSADVAKRTKDEMKARQARAMAALRRVAAEAEDVGDQFARTVRSIHEGRDDPRLVRGTCSREDAEELLEDGIPVMPLPDAALKPLN